MGLLLVLMVMAFAWSMGAHYTGACMGMPHGSGSIRLWPALLGAIAPAVGRPATAGAAWAL